VERTQNLFNGVRRDVGIDLFGASGDPSRRGGGHRGGGGEATGTSGSLMSEVARNYVRRGRTQRRLTIARENIQSQQDTLS